MEYVLSVRIAATSLISSLSCVSMLKAYSSNTYLLGWRLTEFRDQGDRVVVTATSKSNEKTIQISCDYLVGCDGGRSDVRSGLGIELEGEKEVTRDFMGGTMYCICRQMS